jgi:hypothetical protein
VLLEIGRTLLWYLGAPLLLFGVLWIMVQGLIRSRIDLHEPMSWIILAPGVFLMAAGHAIVSWCWRRWGTRSL